MTAYSVLTLNRSADEAYKPFNDTYPPFVPFRDASIGVSTFNVSILDCLRALHRAKVLHWIDVASFNVDEYEFYEKIENGDWNWIIPGKFIAFSSPRREQLFDEEGVIVAHTVVDYIPIFKERNVSTVIRLNKASYDGRRFSGKGIAHHDVIFPDGSTPGDAVLKHFIDICESAEGAIAVHCKAGLGRTGTMIGCYMMKHFGFTAGEVIAYIRMMRPGSIIGIQQHFSKQMQARLWKQGHAFLKENPTLAKSQPLMILESFGSKTSIGSKGSMQRSLSASGRHSPSHKSRHHKVEYSRDHRQTVITEAVIKSLLEHAPNRIVMATPKLPSIFESSKGVNQPSPMKKRMTGKRKAVPTSRQNRSFSMLTMNEMLEDGNGPNSPNITGLIDRSGAATPTSPSHPFRTFPPTEPPHPPPDREGTGSRLSHHRPSRSPSRSPAFSVTFETNTTQSTHGSLLSIYKRPSRSASAAAAESTTQAPNVIRRGSVWPGAR